MTTLKELKNTSKIEQFADDVILLVSQIKDNSIELNKGICRTEELIERAKRGSYIPFDFSRLIEDSEKYE